MAVTVITRKKYKTPRVLWNFAFADFVFLTLLAQFINRKRQVTI